MQRLRKRPQMKKWLVDSGAAALKKPRPARLNQVRRMPERSKPTDYSSSSGSTGSTVELLEPFPWKPRTVVEPKIVYLTLQAGPPAVVAEVSFCGAGLLT